jgi:ferrous iron transport protein B
MTKKILIIGPPNSGKTALFNLLSGSNRKVANYYGITVDTAIAELKSNKNFDEKIEIVDLPGVYSLVPSSIDESVTISTLIGKNNQVSEYHEVVAVIDAARMDSSLSVALAMKEIYGKKMKIIFNKSDLSQAKHYDLKGIGENIGVPFIITSALKGNEEEIDKFIRVGVSSQTILPEKKIALSPDSTQYNPFNVVWKECKNIELTNEVSSLNFIEKFQKKARDLKASFATGEKKDTIKFTNKLDNIALHPILGGLVFAAIFYSIFHAIYTLSGPFMDLIDTYVGAFGELVGGAIPEGMFNSFIVDGVIAGVGGVIIFLPQIMILFFLLSLLEQSGYISRASIITDKLMSMFGLNGKAFLPFMSGFACSVPAIMATRTIADKRERMATLMVIPFITCSARLPVYVLLVGTFVPQETYLGFLNSQALAFFFLYFLGSFTALVMAKVFRLSFFKGETSSFVIELPLYQAPSFKIAAKSMLLKGKVFLRKAGTVILVLSMVIWVLSTFPKPHSTMLEGKTDSEVAAISLEYSAIGKMGKAIEPVIEPLGYNWKMGVGILVAMGARELFVSTLGTIYSLGDVDEESSSLRERMRSELNPKTGLPVYNLAVAWSLLIFFAYGMQCISTLAIVRRETESWKYPVYMFAYMSAMAYGGAFITYRILV